MRFQVTCRSCGETFIVHSQYALTEHKCKEKRNVWTPKTEEQQFQEALKEGEREGEKDETESG